MINKPPLGLTPKDIWEANVCLERVNDIIAAIQRYKEAGLDIPEEWKDELTRKYNFLDNFYDK